MKVIKQIGRGGFGNVDLVEDGVGKVFARKTFSVNQPGGLPPELEANVKKRFVREADVQAAISHINIMPVLLKQLGDEPPSFIMPVATSSLDKDLQLDRGLGGKGINAIMDILAGLEELHSIGITHRDLKPQNVLRLSNGDGTDRYVISDFGLMSIKDTQLSVLTQTGMRMGSDFYTAPEIVADLRMASAASDLYSVGCILHDMYGINNRIPCNEIQDAGPYSDIFLSCTRKDRNRRFQTVSDLREAILAQSQAALTASAPLVSDYINLLTTDVTITLDVWENIVNIAERIYPGLDATALLGQLPLHRISELVTGSPALASRLGVVYSNWVRNSTFVFANCDGIANRLQAFMAVTDINCQSEVLLALLFMGTSHNRWYVERKFANYCGPEMSPALAKRLAVEIRVLNKTACAAFKHLEGSINLNSANFHPVIAHTLGQVC